MSGSTENITIKSLANEDRPREKLMLKGRSVLSDAELIAILIGSGNTKETAVQLSQRILASVNHNLNELGKLSINDLTKFRGIGEAKAISIIAAAELGRRRKEGEAIQKIKIKSSNDAYVSLQQHLSDLSHEEFWILLLNRANEILNVINVSKGGTTGTVVDGKIILKHAIETPRCSGIVLGHNHPSGNLKPSEADIKITHRLKELASFMDINLIDHIIVGEKAYYSFADEGMLR
ncbi:MAG TPA: DNA repair protein RadC [Bacteroidia bacterium]|nr:DNA repair protein RadC [Bacteroidia bacterium]